MEKAHAEGNPLNWDMVTQPCFSQKPGIGGELSESERKASEAVFKTNMAPLPQFHGLENTAVNQPMSQALQKVLNSGVDLIKISPPLVT